DLWRSSLSTGPCEPSLRSISGYGPSETDRDIRFCAAIRSVADIERSVFRGYIQPCPPSAFDHLTITPNDRGELYAAPWFDGVMVDWCGLHAGLSETLGRLLVKSGR